jgi:competence protein ComEA
VNGYPPPSPRIDTDNRLNQPAAVSAPPSSRPGRGKARGAAGDSAAVIDLDVATLDEIDALPRIGPTMAARLLANRDSFGPFRSLDGLRRVKGMGPATLRLLAPRVTFSGRSASTSSRSRY